MSERATFRLSALALAALLAPLLPWQPLQAETVICTTSLEASLQPRPGGGLAQPLEVTRCGQVQSSADLLEQRFFTYTAPYARGVDATHQFTDLIGLSLGGGDGTKLMGLGYPEQTILWDGEAVEATTKALLQRQSTPIPWRTADQPNGYGPSAVAAGAGTGADPQRNSW
jgi:hypothetical protein